MTLSTNLPVIGFTCGDPGGNGYELVLRTLDYFSSAFPFIPIVFCSKSVFAHPFLNSYIKHHHVKDYDASVKLSEGCIYLVDCFKMDNFVIKKPDKQNGKAAFEYLKTAIEFSKKGIIDAIVTAPLCKESLYLADIPYTGHTTILSDLTESKHVSMAFHTSQLNVVLTTIHHPLSAVSSLITPELIHEKIDHSILLLEKLGNKTGKIAVCGLNPHAGESGLLGNEELDCIKPAVDCYHSKKGFEIEGPYSGDTLFYRALNGEFDLVIAMYHDQGLIPIKLLGFREAVNITLGLPFIRTSPDHGTAFDKAYEQLSSIDSMIAATNLAFRFLM